MNSFIITPIEFQKTNKALSEALGVEFLHINYEATVFEFEKRGRGGKTIGTTGYKYTEEQKKNISVSLKGKKSCLGKKHSDETKRKISEFKKGSKWSEETRCKMMPIRKSQKHSEETKQKMREIALKREELKRQTVGK